MPIPKISICLPNLNTVTYLQERIDSIKDQTYGDYEVVICDNYSDDGSYEVFKQYAASDDRVRLFQKPKLGLYQNWNNCISLSKGKWIYIATSDDSMKVDCLERLVELGERLEADVVASDEWFIDQDGKDISTGIPDLRKRVANRPVGHGILDRENQVLCALLYGTPFISITQLLIRRDVFDKTGPFPTDFGSSGDYLWQLRALSNCKWVYLDSPLGAWRVHPTQATAVQMSGKAKMRGLMIRAAIQEKLISNKLKYRLATAYCMSRTGESPEPLGFLAKIVSFIAERSEFGHRLVRGLLAKWVVAAGSNEA